MSQQLFVINEVRLCTERFFPRISFIIAEYLGLIQCVLCDRYSSTICDTCAENFLYCSPSCAVCGKFSANNQTHHNCLENAPFYSTAVTLFHYTKEIKKLFVEYKYQQHFVYQNVVALLMNIALNKPPFPQALEMLRTSRSVLLVPVPMTIKKQEERGFSVPYELCVILGRFLQKQGIYVLIAPCFFIKTKETIAQARKKRNERLLGVSQVFAVSHTAVQMIVRQKPESIVIVDDIITTGATTTALYDVMKRDVLPHLSCPVKLIRFAFAQRFR